MAIKVKLRTKAISGNRQGLYLDFYPAIINPDTGEPTRREFLDLYLYDEIKHETLFYVDKNNKPQKKIAPVLDKAGRPKKVNLNPTEKQLIRKRRNLLNK